MDDIEGDVFIDNNDDSEDEIAVTESGGGVRSVDNMASDDELDEEGIRVYTQRRPRLVNNHQDDEIQEEELRRDEEEALDLSDAEADEVEIDEAGGNDDYKVLEL